MRKFIQLAAIVAATTISAKAQNTAILVSTPVQRPIYVGVKCPDCKTTKLVWNYTKYKGSETIQTDDEETTITIDWRTMEVISDGYVLPIRSAKVLADSAMVIIQYGNHYTSTLTIEYDNRGLYKSHSIK